MIGRSVLVLLVALLAPAGAHAATPSVSGYLDCARAVGVAINNQLAVVPGEREGSKGLYLYTDRRAYFLQLGAPDARNDDADEYFLRTSIANVGDVFLVFRDRTPGSGSRTQPGIGFQSALPAKERPDAYRYTAARVSEVEPAIVPLRDKLKERIVAVTRFLNEKHRYSPPAEAKSGFESDLPLYRARLERCSVEGDRSLLLAVDEELKKLSAGFTGATIWEKQIGRYGLEPTR